MPFLSSAHHRVASIVVDWRALKKAHQLEGCPACGGTIRLGWDTYTCENKECEHFEEDPSLHDIIERDGGHLRLRHCDYCVAEAIYSSYLMNSREPHVY
jgi:hypothetical protein